MARGNFSLDASGLINLLLALTVVTLGLAGLLAWRGYSPVLLIRDPVLHEWPVIAPPQQVRGIVVISQT